MSIFWRKRRAQRVLGFIVHVISSAAPHYRIINIPYLRSVEINPL
jgi:hypothetical protein